MSSPESGIHDSRPRVVWLSDIADSPPGDAATVRLEGTTSTPTPESLAAADAVLIVGPLSNGDRGLELAGALRLALDRGATIVFAYNVRFQQFDERFIRAILPELGGGQITGMVRPAASHPTPHPAFGDYIALHGQNDWRFWPIPETAEVLAHSVVAESPYEAMPSAGRFRVGNGDLYIVPGFCTPQNRGLMTERLIRAVIDHRDGSIIEAPAHFRGLEVPGERDIIEQIESARDHLDLLGGQLATLIHHKHLLGSLAGRPLQQLIIEELNIVLHSSSISVVDVVDHGIEDFRVIEMEGRLIAIGESKAASGGVNLTHVNQLNSHRSELHEAGADDVSRDSSCKYRAE